ncbi:alpha-2-macroglobulin family protein [Aliivibrio kagoshimensis]|uniref:alpha-2-macroglobulin family protein n=1 Tax=Aliivibrio kagoshimensis TaxID=2910230 RepID=UPI003D0CBEE8
MTRFSIARMFAFCIIFTVSFFSFSQQAEKVQEPHLQVIGNGPIVSLSHRALPITSMNVEEVDIEYLRVEKPQSFLLENYFSQRLDSWQLEDARRELKSITIDRYRLPHTEKNVEATSRIKLPQSLEPGWYVAIVNPVNSYSQYEQQIVQILLTDIGIQAKLFEDSLFISATKLSSGSPLNGGIAYVYEKGDLIDSVTLSEQGTAQLDFQINSDNVIVIEHENDQAILPFKEVALDLSEFEISGAQYSDINAFIYSNRDLIKPGELVPINVLLRDADGELVENQSLQLSVVKPDNQVMYSEQLVEQQKGYYRTDVSIPFDADVGRWRVEVRSDPTANRPLNGWFFQVQEFVPERMELIVSHAPESVIANRSFGVDLSGRYLFGALADGNRVNTTVMYDPVRHFSGPYKEYFVGQDFYLSEYYQDLDSVRLDTKGLGQIFITPPREDLLSPIKGIATLDLMEEGATGSQSSFDFTAWYSKPIPAISPHNENPDYDSLAQFDLLLLNQDGSQTVDGNVEVEYFENQGRYYWTYEEGRGWEQHDQPEWKSLKTESLVLTNKPVTVNLKVKWGEYRVVVTETSSGVKTVYDFYAGWGDSNQQMPAKPGHLDLKLDKIAYQNGDSVEVSYTSPIKGSLLVTVESEEVLWSQSLKVKSNQPHTITIPISEAWRRHDLYISAVVTGNNRQGIASRLQGIKHLPLDRESRIHQVQITLPEKLEPLKTVLIPVNINTIKENEGSGKAEQNWVTLSLVDKGVTNISGYLPTNPANVFFGQQRYGADIIDLFSRLYDQRLNPFATPRFGSDDVTPEHRGNLVESKTVLFMSEAVAFNEEGNAFVEVTLPDYNGEAQVVATTFSERRYGQKTENITIAAPVISELAVPRFLAPGDQSMVHLDLFNRSGKAQTLALSLLSSQENSLDLSKLPTKVTLDDGEHFSIAVPVTLAKTLTSTNFTLTLAVSNSEIDIERDWRVPVRQIMPLVKQRHLHLLQPDDVLTISPKHWQSLNIADNHFGTLQVSASPQINSSEYLSQLFQYPYGCAEQTISKGSAYLLDSDQVNSEKRRFMKEKPEREWVLQAVQRLAGFQNSYGGFGLWSSSGQERPWLTVYATEFLQQANLRHPGVVPAAVIESAQNRIEQYVRRESLVSAMVYRKEESGIVRSYAVYLLALQGKARWADIDKMVKSVNQKGWLSKLSAVQLAASFALVGDEKRAKALLNKSANLSRTKRYYLSDYGSEIRDQALIVTITEQLKTKQLLDVIEYQISAIESVIEQLDHRQWLSTQESSALVKASLITEQMNRTEVAIKLDNLVERNIGSIRVATSPNQQVHNISKVPLYIELTTQGYPKETKTQFNNMDLRKLTRTLLYPDGSQYDGERLNVGDRLIAVIEVNTRQHIMDGMLVDLIPAGFILENPNLGDALNTSNVRYEGKPLSEYAEHYNNVFDRIEYRNDRFVAAKDYLNTTDYVVSYTLRAEVPGQYTQPPLYLESMYQPYKNASVLQGSELVTITDENK